MDREQAPSLLPLGDTAALPTFDVALRGYDRRQVDEYLDRIEQDLAQAQSEREAAVDSAGNMRQRLETLEKEVHAARRQLVENAHPTYAGLGGRVEELLRLAEEEAGRVRAEAARDSATARQNDEKLVAEATQRAAKLTSEFDAAMSARRHAAKEELANHQANLNQRIHDTDKRIAEAESLGKARIAQAAAEVDKLAKDGVAQLERMRQDSERHAAALVQAARADADRVLAEARIEADRILSDARAQADRRRAESEREIAGLQAHRAKIDRQLESLREVLGGLPGSPESADSVEGPGPSSGGSAGSAGGDAVADQPTRPTPGPGRPLPPAGQPHAPAVPPSREPAAPPSAARPTPVARSGSGG